MTYSFLDRAELFELRAQGRIICVPCQATIRPSAVRSNAVEDRTYPMNNFAMFQGASSRSVLNAGRCIHNHEATHYESLRCGMCLQIGKDS